MKHLMIDLETMGTRANAPVLSIGACFFDPNTGSIGGEFHRRIEWNSGFAGRVADPNTIKWWMKQSKEAQDGVLRSGADVTNVLWDFHNWCVTGLAIKAWGNGATFDISMMENIFQQYGIPIPWNFWDVRDVRTIVELAEGILDCNSIKFEGIQHNALDDAKHQARYVSAMWQALRAENMRSQFKIEKV